jgi:hypothetical protein
MSRSSLFFLFDCSFFGSILIFSLRLLVFVRPDPLFIESEHTSRTDTSIGHPPLAVSLATSKLRHDWH